MAANRPGGPPSAASRVAVLGAGNALLGDDGVGVAVVEALRSIGLERRFPGLTLVEAGTAAFEAVALLDEAVTRLVVVDAVEGGGPPGAVYRFDLEAVSGAPPERHLSVHQETLVEALRMAELSGRRFEELVVIGVEPAEVAWGADLSEAVRARLAEVVDLVAAEVARLAE